MSDVLQQIASTLGPQAADRIGAECAGQCLYVGATPSPTLVHVLGERQAARLTQTFAGEYLVVPRARRTAQRDRLIRSALAAGDAQNVLAARYGLSVRHIRRIANGR